ncbi:hypothetical protein [Nocardioides yefusunii]|uniref:Uncharacterized protein n=1 Tax=Nocardioides yefusunii TaxID=2500546 RepID=A0ABW1QY91_9ACTN|nr:hypothetical protein [Nocardioides yefusunii]
MSDIEGDPFAGAAGPSARPVAKRGRRRGRKAARGTGEAASDVVAESVFALFFRIPVAIVRRILDVL